MSWLDGVFAAPVIGIRFRPSFRVAMAYHGLLSGMLDELLADGARLGVNPLQPAGLLVELRDRDLSLRMDVNNAVAEYRVRLDVSQEIDDGEIRSETKRRFLPYSDALLKTQELLCKGLHALARADRPQLADRIGVVARVFLTADSLPPGVEALKIRLYGQWKKHISLYEGRVVVRFPETEDFQDQCHIQMSFDETSRPDLLQLTLDWQRVYAVPFAVGAKESTERVADVSAAALEYFEAIATGEFDD